jgi:hypothetical protein
MTMGRYLSNVLRAGGRPIGRKGGAVRRVPAVPALNLERIAAPLEPQPQRAAEAPREKVPTQKAEPVLHEPEPQATAREPVPVETEAPVLPAVDQTPEPRPRAEAPVPPAEPEPVMPEVAAEVMAPLPPPRTAPAVAASFEPIRRLKETGAEGAKRAITPPPRIPVPARVETKPEPAIGAAVKRLIEHRDAPLPQWPANVAPRVEFITTERVVTVLPKPAPVERERPPQRAEVQPAPPSRNEPPAPGPVRPPAPPRLEVKPQAPPPPAWHIETRREQPAPVPASPIAPLSAFATERRAPEPAINIRHLDIQIVNEEPRKPARRSRSAPPPVTENASRGLERHYIREVM